MSLPLSMRALTPVALVLALAACQDRATPLATEIPGPSASVYATTCTSAADARAHELINVLYAPTQRDERHRRFNRGRQLAAAGRLADAWSTFTPLLNEIDQIGDAATSDATKAAVAELTALILVCSGQPVDPAVLALLNMTTAERALRDLTLQVVFPDAGYTAKTPSQNFATSGPAGFFVQPALLIISRIPDEPPFLPHTYEEFPPRYNVTVVPYSAQANYPAATTSSTTATTSSTTPLATVAICPTHEHELDPHDLRILRRPEPGLGHATEPLEPTNPGTLLPVECAEAGEFPLATASVQPTRLGQFFASVGRIAGRAGSLFAPSVAHAIDGGIGGKTTLYSDFVVARPWSGH